MPAACSGDLGDLCDPAVAAGGAIPSVEIWPPVSGQEAEPEAERKWPEDRGDTLSRGERRFTRCSLSAPAAFRLCAFFSLLSLSSVCSF